MSNDSSDDAMSYDASKVLCGHCDLVLDWDELDDHFIAFHPEWVTGTDQWYRRISDEWKAEQQARRAVLKGRPSEQYDHEFLTGCGIREE